MSKKVKQEEGEAKRNINFPFMLYSYIATEMLAPFFATLVILYGIFFLIRLVPLLEIVLNLNIGFQDFIRLFFYISPTMLLYIIPMASMAGTVIAFSRLNNDKEILALKSCGVSIKSFIPPVIMVAGSIATLTALFSIQLIPEGEKATRQLLFQLAKEKIDRGLKEHQFTEALGDLVVYVDNIDDNNAWHGVYVSDMRDRKQPAITMAKNGRMVADVENMHVLIQLDSGSTHITDGNDNQIILFKKYQLDIPLKPPTKIGNENVSLVDRKSMSQEELREVFQSKKYDDKYRVVFKTEYYERLAFPVGSFILSLIAFTLALQSTPGKRNYAIPLCLGLFILYHVLTTSTRVMAEDLKIDVITATWIPNLAFSIFAIYLFYQVHNERQFIPRFLSEPFLKVTDKIKAKLKNIFKSEKIEE